MMCKLVTWIANSLLYPLAGFSLCGLLATSLPGAPNYPVNQSPLATVPYVALPLGSVQAKGWILQQLELQRDGLTGFAEEVIPELDPQSGWLGGKGENWEKGPYYVKGLVPLAYTLDDPQLKTKAQKWIAWTLASQKPDGFFGPAANQDWWPRMVATYFLRDYAEATGDPRVIPFLTRYYQHMAAELPKRPLRDWGKARAGDEMDTIIWLYNRTKESFLLFLLDTLKAQAYDWNRIFAENAFLDYGEDFHPKHGVNVAQAAKFPAVYFQRSQNLREKAVFEAGEQYLCQDHGLAFGINSGTEFLSGRSTAQGTEFCSFVEKLLSYETAIRILGDAALGDRMETLAFNGVPAAWSRDLKQYQYFTIANEVVASRKRHGYVVDYDDGLLPGPHSGCHCCCYNIHMGWPKYLQNSWAATPDGGLALLAYAPSEVNALVGDKVPIKITEQTDYPFTKAIALQVAPRQAAAFPLHVRIPSWCKQPVVMVNGKKQANVKPGTFHIVRRTWQPRDVVTLEFPMELRVAEGCNRSVHIEYGPLLFALKIGEQRSIVTSNALGFHEYSLAATTPWNYALAVDPAHPKASITVEQSPVVGNPFAAAQPPLQLRAQARRLPAWTLAWDGSLTFDPPYSPVTSTEPVETVTLVPFGSQSLRVTEFPRLGKPAFTERRFADDFADGNALGWVNYGGGWFVKDGQYHVVSSGGGGPWPGLKSVATGTRFANFEYEADVAVGPEGNAGLIFRVAQPAMGADAYQGYYVGISAKGTMELGKADGRSYTSLSQAKAAIAPHKLYRIKVSAVGDALTVWLAGQASPVLSAKDASWSAGAIGVREYCPTAKATVAHFDNIRVQAK